MPKLLRLLRLLPLLLSVMTLVLGITGASAASDPTVTVLRVDGPIVPVVGEYVDRGIAAAESRNDTAVIIELNTPGGLYDTTQKIVERILNARVPVVVYVSPAGGWAGSAGAFITLSANIAAMAPGSRIGASTPVGGSGQLDPAMQEKVTEDAAAFMRSIATLRGRDPDRAESAVRQARSFSDTEALQGNLIDLRAQTLSDLLDQIDGRRVTLAGGREVTLQTSGATTRDQEMSLIERFLQIISNPNVAYILLTLGSIGIIVELYNPGTIFPGVVGGVSLLLGLYSLGVMNANWAGAALILLAFGLFVADLFVTSHGVLTAGAIAALIAGSLMLFSGNPGALQVSKYVIAAVVVTLSLFFVFALAAVVRARMRKPVTGREFIVGRPGRAITPLSPEGMVLVDGERWSATTVDGQPLEPGEDVVVTRIDGLLLTVSKKKS